MADRRHSDFWAKVHKTDCCWLWTHSTGSGYGQAWRDGRPVRAHRVAYEAAYGPIPAGRLVIHDCDVRRCVRPDHLRVGTHAENTADMDARGRRVWRQARAKLTAAQVIAIRASYAAGTSQMELARTYGVTNVTIWKIVHGENWRAILPGATFVPTPRRRLTEEQVSLMRQLRREGLTVQRIADQLEVHRVTVANILRGATHKSPTEAVA